MPTGAVDTQKKQQSRRMEHLEIKAIENREDSRGESYYVPEEAIDFVGGVREIHLATIRPGAVRGNHYHIGRRESILLVFADSCRLVWKHLKEQEVFMRDFEGNGSMLIQVQPEVVHAIKNIGGKPIHLVTFSCQQFDQDHPDTFRQVLIE